MLVDNKTEYTSKCRICGFSANEEYVEPYRYCNCKHCGSYILSKSAIYLLNGMSESYYDKKKLKIFLYYNKNDESSFYLGDRNGFNRFISEKEGRKARCADVETIENWFPKTFAEKIDMILLKLYDLSKFDGDYIDRDYCEEASLYMCDSKQNGDEYYFISRFLHENDYVDYQGSMIQLQPTALARIDKLQKK